MGDRQWGAVAFQLALNVCCSHPNIKLLFTLIVGVWIDLLCEGNLDEFISLAVLALLYSVGGVQTGSVWWMSTWRPSRLAVVAKCEGSCCMIMLIGLCGERWVVVRWISSMNSWRVARMQVIWVIFGLLLGWAVLSWHPYFQPHCFVCLSLLALHRCNHPRLMMTSLNYCLSLVNYYQVSRGIVTTSHHQRRHISFFP